MTTQQTCRNKVFDVVRALCMIYIVCFWHLHNYLHITLYDIVLKYCSACTIIVLGTFTFMSGYFLKKYQIESWIDVKIFIIKRLKRFYVPYMLCLIILWLGNWFVDERQFIFSMIGLSTYIHPLPKTIWYFSMLMSFYAITPLILYTKNKVNKLVTLSLLICVVILFAVWGDINGLYFPFYLLGIFITEQNIKKLCNKKWILFFTIVLLLITTLPRFFGREWLIIFCGIFPLIKLSDIILKIIPYSFWHPITYASMMAYLYHRIHFKLISEIINNETFSKRISFVIIGCITLFVISFFLQKWYDWLLNKISCHQN